MKISGTGSAIPKRVVTNDELSKFLDTSDEWIIPRTGIRTRHVITDEEIEDLASEAALKAIADSGLEPDNIDYFICSHVVSEHITPSLSCIVASKIGLRCPCFDINCACPGFIFALDMAEAYCKAGKAKNILILCAEEPTRMCDWSDRATCVLFGDGAGAVVLTPGDNIKGIKLHSQPAPDKIWQRRKMLPTPFITKEETESPLMMKGKDVFKFAVNASTTEVEALLKELGIQKEQVSYYLVHQANMRIIDAIKNYLGAPEEKFPTNIADHGNSSSASCPILLDEFNKKGIFKKGDIMVFSAFGAGLLSGAAVLEW